MKQNEIRLRTMVALTLKSAMLLAAQVATAAAATSQATTLQSAGHAMLLFVIVWLIASLRIGKRGGIWRFAIELSPVKRVAGAPAATTPGPQEPRS